MRVTARILAAGVVLAATAACGNSPSGNYRPQNASEARLTPSAPMIAAPAPPAAAALAVPRAEIWRLRSGLNVAALSCRGHGVASVKGHYAQMLERHSALLDQTYRQEVGRHGVNGHDRQQTKVYNRFAMQRSPQKFCSVAAEVAQRAVAMSSAELSPASPDLVARLESGLQ